MPSASIITPLFNKGPYVAETIRSVLAQTMPDWEMIVVENGSTDQGPEVARQFSDVRVRLVDSPKRGPGAARNFGLGLATGEWVLFLDADDLLEPGYLAARLADSASVPQAQIIAGCWQEFSDGSPDIFSPGWPTGWGCDTGTVLDYAIGAAPWILHAALVRRNWITAERGWPEALDRLPSEDVAFWFQIILGAQVAWSGHTGALYRVATPTSRNAFRGADTRTQAVGAVIEHNLEFLRSRGATPTPGQCQTLMRVFEDTYRWALAAQAGESAQSALRQAETWLRRCTADGMALSLRKILGLRLFNLVRFGAW